QLDAGSLRPALLIRLLDLLGGGVDLRFLVSAEVGRRDRARRRVPEDVRRSFRHRRRVPGQRRGHGGRGRKAAGPLVTRGCWLRLLRGRRGRRGDLLEGGLEVLELDHGTCPDVGRRWMTWDGL